MANWPWKKEPTDTSQLPNEVPEEVQEYYENTRRERVGVAWLLSLVTLVITVLIAIGLFFGGRWLYRVIFDTNDNQQTTQQQGGDVSQPIAPENTTQNNANTTGQNGNRTDDNVQPTPAPSTPSSGATEPTPAAQPSPQPPQTPHTGPTEIPRTGPIGDD